MCQSFQISKSFFFFLCSVDTIDKFFEFFSGISFLDEGGYLSFWTESIYKIERRSTQEFDKIEFQFEQIFSVEFFVYRSKIGIEKCLDVLDILNECRAFERIGIFLRKSENFLVFCGDGYFVFMCENIPVFGVDFKYGSTYGCGDSADFLFEVGFSGENRNDVGPGFSFQERE